MHTIILDTRCRPTCNNIALVSPKKKHLLIIAIRALVVINNGPGWFFKKVFNSFACVPGTVTVYTTFAITSTMTIPIITAFLITASIIFSTFTIESFRTAVRTAFI